jgi:hypothetical protein
MKPLAVAIAFLLCSAAYGSPIWIEEFETGVGRFDQIRGAGDQRHPWHSKGRIRSFFIQDGADDRRYAPLGETFKVNDNVLGFSVVVEPQAVTTTDDVLSGIGFWNSGNDFLRNRLGISVGLGDYEMDETEITIQGRYADGTPVSPSDSLPYLFFHAYFIDVVVDGPAHRVTASVYEGRDDTGDFLGTISTALDPERWLAVDSLGMGGVEGSGQAIVMFVDDFAFTIPEPATILFVLFGGILCLGLGKPSPARAFASRCWQGPI